MVFWVQSSTWRAIEREAELQYRLALQSMLADGTSAPPRRARPFLDRVADWLIAGGEWLKQRGARPLPGNSCFDGSLLRTE